MNLLFAERFIPSRQTRVLCSALLCTLAVAILDLSTPLAVDVAVLYSAIIFHGLWLSHRQTVALGALHAVLIVAALFLPVPEGWLMPAIVTRCAILFAVLAIVLLLERYKATEEGYRRLYDDTPSMYFTVDANKVIISVNQYGAERLGYHAQELVGQPVTCLVYGPDVENVAHHFERLFANHTQNTRLQFRKVRKDGSVLSVQETVRLTRSSDGRVVALIVCEDITKIDKASQALTALTEQLEKRVQERTVALSNANEELQREVASRKAAEHALRESQERLANTELFSVLMVTHVALDGRWLKVPRRLCELLGYTEEELLSQTFKEVTHPDDYDADWQQCQRLMHGEIKSFDLEKRYIAKDGRCIWIYLNCSGVYDQAETLVHFLTYIRDISAQKEIEEALKASEEKWRTVIETVPLGIAISTIEGAVLDVNTWGWQLFGYESKSEFLARGAMVHYLYPKDRERRIEALKRGDRVFEAQYHRKDGSSFWGRCTAAIYGEWNGEVLLINAVEDITARRQAEEELKQVQNEQQVIFDSVPAMLWYKDKNNRIVRANRLAARSMGLTVREVEGVQTEALYPELAGKYHQDDLEVIDSGQPKRGLVERYQSAELGERWVCTDKVPYRDKKGQVTGVIVFAVDITERVYAEEELVRRDSILGAIGHAAGLMLTTQTWKAHLHDVLECLGNAADADRLCIYRRAAVGVASTMSPVLQWHRHHPKRDAEDRSFAGQDTWTLFSRWESKLRNGELVYGLTEDFQDDEQHWLRWNELKAVVIVPIQWGSEWWGILEVGRTESSRVWLPAEIDALQVASRMVGGALYRQAMEEEIRRYQQELEQRLDERTKRIQELESQRAQTEKLAALGQLVAGVAHEINNPIAGIKNAFQLISDAIPKDHPDYDCVSMIHREIERITQIVRQMYHLNGTRPRREQFRTIKQLVSDLQALVQGPLQAKQVTLHVTVDAPGSERIRLSTRILQVLLNLVRNAAEACPEESGRITLAISEAENMVTIRVSDNGRGIKKEDLPRVFEPFFSRKRKGDAPGMGLGLAISHSIVRALGGTLSVMSFSGKGTTFTVVVPVGQRSSSGARHQVEGL